MLDAFYRVFLWNAVVALLLALFVGLLCLTRFAHRRPALRHALWSLVLVKLITPPLVPVAVLPDKPIAQVPVADNSVAAAVRMPKELLVSKLPPVGVGANVETNSRRVAGSPGPDTTGAVSLRSWMSWPVLLLCGWGTGAGILLWRQSIRTRYLVQLLRRAETAPADVQAIVAEVQQQAGIAGNITTSVVDAPITPFIWDRLGPASIILPRTLTKDLAPAELRAIVAHELGHWLRHDSRINLFARFVTTIWWFHPVAWWAQAEMRKAQDLCCDELAIERGQLSRKCYLTTLLRIIDFLDHKPLHSPSPASGFGASQSLRQRCEAIATGRVVSRHSRWSVLAVILVCGGLTCWPVAGQTTPQRQEPSGSVLAGRGKSAKIEKPTKLFLHWLAPPLKNRRQARLLKTIEIKPGIKFSIKFRDPQFKSRKCSINGKIVMKNDKLIGLVQAIWKSGTQFKGSYKLEQVSHGKPLGFASAYHATCIVLSRHPSGSTFVKKLARKAPPPAAVGKKGPVPKGLKVKPIPVKWSDVVAVDVSHNTRWMVLGTKAGQIVRWDLATRGRSEPQDQKLEQTPGRPIAVLAIHPSNDLVAFGRGKLVRFYSIKENKVLANQLKIRARVTAIAFSPDGNRLLVGTAQGAVDLWDYRVRLKNLFQMKLPAPITVVAFSSDGKHLAAGTADGSTRVWRANGELSVTLKDKTPVTALGFSQDASVLGVGHSDTHVRQWSTATGKRDWKSPTNGGPVRWILYVYNKQILYVATKKRLTFREGRDGKIISIISGLSSPQQGIALVKLMAGLRGPKRRVHLINLTGGR